MKEKFRNIWPVRTVPRWVRPLWRDSLVIVCLAALVLLFFWRFLTPKVEDRVAFPPGDFTDQFFAWRVFEARELNAGRLPLWNPYFNSGHPFLADAQAAVLYPIGLAVTLLASRSGDFPVEALQYEAFLHVFLSAAFTYLFALRLLRRRGQTQSSPGSGRLGAFVAALSFAFGGYLTSYPPLQLAILETVTWLPLWLLALDVAAERGTLLTYLSAGAVLAMAVLAGHSQTLLLMLYTGALYYSYLVLFGGTSQTPGAVSVTRRLVLSRAIGFAVIVGIGAALAAAQLLPTAEYALQSTRSGLAFAESSKGVPPLQLLQMLVPGVVSAFSSPLYVGFISLWMALTVVAVRRDRVVAIWVGLALIALLDTLGGYSFFYSLLYMFAPGFALFRGQERAAAVFSFSLAILAGYGAEAFVHWLPRKPKRAFTGTLKALAWLPFGGLVLTLAFFYATRILDKPGMFIFLVDRAALMTLIGALSAGLVAARLWGWARLWQVRPLLILLLLLDLFTVNWSNNQGAVADRFPARPMIQAMQADTGLFRIEGDALPGHAGVVYRLEDTGGFSPLTIRVYDDLVRGLSPTRLRSLLSVRYLVALELAAPAGMQPLIRETGGSLYRLPEPLPRAWVTANVVVEPDPTRVLTTLASSDFDLRSAVILSEQPALLPASAAVGTAVVTAHRPDRVLLDVQASGPAMVVVSEVFYPGWRATVDGAETTIFRADHALRAVQVPAGRHNVEMVFDPLSFRLGAVVSLATLLAAAVLFLRAVRRARWR
jgi:hypothetical protein